MTPFVPTVPSSAPDFGVVLEVELVIDKLESFGSVSGVTDNGFEAVEFASADSDDAFLLVVEFAVGVNCTPVAVAVIDTFC